MAYGNFFFLIEIVQPHLRWHREAFYIRLYDVLDFSTRINQCSMFVWAIEVLRIDLTKCNMAALHNDRLAKF